MDIMRNTVTILGGGIIAMLIGTGVIGVVMIVINVLFNYMLFHTRGVAGIVGKAVERGC
jgi:hypothetical protein